MQFLLNHSNYTTCFYLIIFLIYHINATLSNKSSQQANQDCATEKINKYSKEANTKYIKYLNLIQDAKRNYKPCNTNRCNCHAPVMAHDLRIFKEKGISEKQVQAVKSKGTKYQIINHKLYRDSNCMFPSRCAGIEHFLLEILPQLPDMEFVVNTRDWPQIPKKYGIFGPVFSFSKTDEYNDIMYPAWAFWEGGPAISLYPRGIGRWDSHRQKLGKLGNSTKWEDKIAKVFFRGSRTCSERDPLILLSRENPDLVDAQYTKNQAWKSEVVLFGLLALGHAKPEGYSYQRPQILPQPTILPQQIQPLQRLTLNQGQQSLPIVQESQPLQLSLNQGQQSASFQQSLPIVQESQPLQRLTFNQGQQNLPIVQESQPLQLSLNQGQQSLPLIQPSQEFLPQSRVLNQHSEQGYSYQQPQLNVQPQPQFNVQPQPQLNVQPQFNVQVQQPQPHLIVQQQQPQFNVQVQQPQPQFNVQQQQPQFNVQLPQPQLNVHIPLPQGNLNNFQAALQESLPQIPIQSQVQFNQVEQLPQDNVGQNLLVSSQESQQELSGQNNFADVSSQQQASLVTKHVSFHVAPEEPEEVTQIISQPLPARKNYKIIFIKAPTLGLTRTQIIAQQAAQVQEKTLVYVLVNKPHASELVLPTVAPAPVSKPEVYFIKYKSNSNGNGPSLVDGGSLGDSSSGPTGAGLPIVEDIARGQGQGQVLVNSGESSSSLFSGGLPGPTGPTPQYGVPGYQKRSSQK